MMRVRLELTRTRGDVTVKGAAEVEAPNVSHAKLYTVAEELLVRVLAIEPDDPDDQEAKPLPVVE